MSILTVYAKGVIAALDTPRTLEELQERTGWDFRFVMRGLQEARAAGYSIHAVGRKGLPTTFEMRGDQRDSAH